jgi:hypothetical protein
VLGGLAADASIILGSDVSCAAATAGGGLGGGGGGGSGSSVCGGQTGGDVHVTMAPSVNSVLVVAEQDLGAICLTAPQLLSLVRSNTTCVGRTSNGTAVNATAAGLSCAVREVMCQTTVRRTDCARLPPSYNVTARAVNGGVYVRLAAPDVTMSPGSVFDGGGFTTPEIVFTSAAAADFRGFVQAVPNSDVLAMVDLGTSAGFWMLATRPVFLQLRPHVIGALSGSLLMPRVVGQRACFSWVLPRHCRSR